MPLDRGNSFRFFVLEAKHRWASFWGSSDTAQIVRNRARRSALTIYSCAVRLSTSSCLVLGHV